MKLHLSVLLGVLCIAASHYAGADNSSASDVTSTTKGLSPVNKQTIGMKISSIQNQIRSGYELYLAQTSLLQRDREIDKRIASGEENVNKPKDYISSKERKVKISMAIETNKPLIPKLRELLNDPEASKLPRQKREEILKFLETAEKALIEPAK